MNQHHVCVGVDPSAPLFSAERFVPRASCGAWDPALLEVYAHASISITAAYLVIGGLLGWTAWRILRWHRANPGSATRHAARAIVETLADAHLSLLLWTYGAFILFCGVGHLEGLIAFSHPIYHVFALWHAVTAIASWWAVVVTWHVAMRIVAKV